MSKNKSKQSAKTKPSFAQDENQILSSLEELQELLQEGYAKNGKEADNKGVSLDINLIEKYLPPKKKRSHHTIIRLDKVYKSFQVGRQQIEVLKNIKLNLYSGEFAIVHGPSGCGKSTFLHTVLGLEPPTKGKVYLRGKDLYGLKSDERTNFRRKKIGMMFQQSNWIKSLSVWQNVAYPLWLDGQSESAAKTRAYEVLESVGMVEHAHYHPNELSGGQQQRVAVARALATEPFILIADEPTGNLDSKSGTELIMLLAKLNREQRRMILMVTHDVGFLPIATRRISMKDGVIINDENDG